MQQQAIASVLQHYERKQVPRHEGRTYVSLSLVFLGILIAIPSLLLGSALVSGVGLKGAASTSLLGALIAAPICLLVSHVGTRGRVRSEETRNMSQFQASASKER